MSRKSLLFSLGVIALLTAGIAAFTDARSPGSLLAETQRKMSAAQDDTPVVVSVDGTNITLGQMQAATDMGLALMSTYSETLSEEEIYRLLLGKMVMNTAVYRQAQAEGFDATEEEARAELESVRANAAGNPLLKEYFDRLETLPKDERERIQADLLEGYRRAIVAAKWYQNVREQVQMPSAEEVAQFLDSNPTYRNILVVSAISLDDYQQAQNLYAELEKAFAERDESRALALFDEKARTYDPERKTASEVFYFLNPTNCPIMPKRPLPPRKAVGTCTMRRTGNGWCTSQSR